MNVLVEMRKQLRSRQRKPHIAFESVVLLKYLLTYIYFSLHLNIYTFTPDVNYRGVCECLEYDQIYTNMIKIKCTIIQSKSRSALLAGKQLKTRVRSSSQSVVLLLTFLAFLSIYANVSVVTFPPLLSSRGIYCKSQGIFFLVNLAFFYILRTSFLARNLAYSAFLNTLYIHSDCSSKEMGFYFHFHG